jgi:hypothetical protein
MRKVMICCNHLEADELAAKIKLAGFHATRSKDRTATKFHITSKAFVMFLQPFGRGAKHKRIPGWFFTAPQTVQRALWRGWIEADGHVFASGVEQGTTVSLALAYGLARVARNGTGRPVAVNRQAVKSTTVIEGREVNQSTQYQIRLSPSSKEAFIEDGYCWSPTRAVRHVDRIDTVYNIEVEGDNSYTAGSFAVHNCQDVSGAGKQAGIKEGTRSGLWYEYRRIVSEIRPRFCVVENVASGKGRWLCEVRTDLHALGYATRAYALSAADVGAPHLRRRIFVVGHADGYGRRTEREGAERSSVSPRIAEPDGHGPALGDADGTGRQGAVGGRVPGEAGGLTEPAGHRGEAVADGDGIELRERPERVPGGRTGGLRREGGTEPRHAGAPVADGDGDGRVRVAAGGLHAHGACRHDADGRHRFPPLRGDDDGWAEYIAAGGPQPGIRRGLHGVPAGLDPALAGGSRGVGGGSERAARLRALGNAVVPQCGEAIGLVVRSWMTELLDAAR